MSLTLVDHIKGVLAGMVLILILGIMLWMAITNPLGTRRRPTLRLESIDESTPADAPHTMDPIILRTTRGWGPGRRWHSRYPGAVGYPIAGYSTWRDDAIPCVMKCTDELSDCDYASPGDPLCDVMYRSCISQC